MLSTNRVSLAAYLLPAVAAIWPAGAFAAKDTGVVVSVPGPVDPGLQVPIQAKVSYTAGVTSAIFPGGTVDFTDNGAPIPGCSGLLLAPSQTSGTATATCSTLFSQPGTFTIKASYAGDAGSNPSSGVLSLTVMSATTVMVALKSGSPQIGQVLTLQAAVSGAGGLPFTGTVAFTSNGNAIPGCSGASVQSGTAVCMTTFAQAGTWAIAAAYAGDSGHHAGTGSMQLGIDKAFPVPYIASYVLGAQSNGQYYASQAVTIGAKFAQAPSVVPPTGTATFYDGNSVLAKLAVSASGCDLVGYSCVSIVAPSLSMAGLAPGTHSITAVYSGDANYQPSTTAVHTIAIAKTPTTPYFTANPDGSIRPLIAAQPLTLGAAFPAPPGSIVGPTGSIAFYDGSALLASVPMDVDGHALLTIPSGAIPAIGAGSHSFKAAYQGDATYLPADTASASGGVAAMTVQKASVTLAVASSPFQPGQPVAIAVLPVVSSPGILAANGTLDFTAAGASIGGCAGLPATVSGGAQKCTFTPAQGGVVTVSYTGDANTSTASATLTLSSAKAQAALYAESVNTTPVLGETITIDVRLFGPSGFPAPTGTVAFTDGSAGGLLLGSAAVGSDGHVLLVVPGGALALGDHNIVASYSGDALYLAGTALPLPVSVKQDFTSVVISAPPAKIGQPLTVSAAVAVISPGTSVPTGPINFYNLAGGVAASCNPATQNQISQCSLTVAALDTLTPAVNYLGDGTTLKSNVSPALSAAHALAGIYLNPSSPNPVLGMPVTIEAVLIAAPGVATPTGSVSFRDNGAVLATVPVGTNGRAALTAPSSIPALSVGTHTITAVYNGDASYEASPVAASTEIVVTKAVIKLDLAASAGQPGQSATLKAAVTVLGPESPVSVGSVDFGSGGTSIGGCVGVPVQNGVAQCVTNFALGTYTITASYSGFPNAAAITASLQLTVGKPAAGFYISAYSTTLPYGAGFGVRGLLMGTPPPTGTVTFSDGAATLAAVPVGADGTAPLTIPSMALPPLAVGTHSISAAYSGDSNYKPAGAAPLSVTITKAATSVAVYVAPPQINQPVLLKASVTVVSPGVAVPGGTIDFTSGGAPVPGCTGLALQNGSALCGATFSQLTNVSVTAAYAGDAYTTPSTYSVPIAVGKAVAGMYGASAPPEPVFGQAVVLRALLMGAAGVPAPSGTVTFSEGSAVLGTGAVGPDGHASLTLPAGALTAGRHVFTVNYAGDPSYAAGTSTLTVAVSKASTATALAALFGAPLTATVSVLAPGAGTPTGTVQFFLGGVSAGTAPVSMNGGTFSATISGGSWSGSAWAVYSGDANFAGSASPSVGVAPGAKVSIASDHNPATAGQAITFTVAVAPLSGSITPTGRVQVTVDGAVLANADLVSGTATVAAGSSLSAGSHTVVASYSGDSAYPPASATLAQVVTKTVVSLTLSPAPASSVYGQPVAFTAQVSGASGTVQFLDGSAALGSAPVQSGTAALTLATLAAGTHTIVATWADESGSSAAASAPLPFVVAKAQTATLLRASGLSVTATVSAVAPGAGTPAGTVQFVNAANNSVLASVMLSGGTALAAQPATAGPVVAVYSGDANFAGSTSVALAPLAVTNAASFASDSFAPDEIVTLFGADLAAATVASTAAPAATLGGTTAAVTDSSGVRRSANLLFVSPSQVSAIVPPGTPNGPAVIAITNAAGATFAAPLAVARVAPGLFTADGSGKGAPVGQTIRAGADGTQDAPRDLAAGPIDLGNGGDTVYLVLYGTGIRHQSTATAAFTCANCVWGAQPVAYAGAQGTVAGLDQVNLALPAALRGAGQVSLTLTVDGVSSNAVTLTFR